MKSLNFKRGFFIKDLLSQDSICRKASIFEFEDLNTFESVVNQCYINRADTWIIPVTNKSDVVRLMDILNKGIPQVVIIKLLNITEDILNSFNPLLDRYYLMVPYNEVTSMISLYEDKRLDLSRFRNIFDTNPGIVELNVSRSNIDNLYQDISMPYLKLPYLSRVNIKWEYSDLEKLSIESIKILDVQLFWIKENLINRSININIDDKSYNFTFDLWYYNSPNKVYISKDLDIYSSNIKLIDSKVPNLDVDCNKVHLSKIDNIRSFYDIEFNDTCRIDNIGLIDIYENYKTSGNPGIIPYSCKIIDRLLGMKYVN